VRAIVSLSPERPLFNVATVLPNGFAQVSPRGSTMVYDDEHLALWEQGNRTILIRDSQLFFVIPPLFKLAELLWLIDISTLLVKPFS